MDMQYAPGNHENKKLKKQNGNLEHFMLLQACFENRPVYIFLGSNKSKWNTNWNWSKQIKICQVQFKILEVHIKLRQLQIKICQAQSKIPKIKIALVKYKWK